MSEFSDTSIAACGAPTVQCRRLNLGATVEPNGVAFRVWAPKRRRVEVLLENLEKPASLEKDQRGYFSGLVIEAQAGMRYRYRLDGEQVHSDPCSQYQGESATFFAAVPAVSMGC